jgi:phage terminase large subunit GpA-like protein
MAFNYGDVNCPHCGHINRIRFIVHQVPFGETTIKPDDPDICYNCKLPFVGTARTTYGARKLSKYEESFQKGK